MRQLALQNYLRATHLTPLIYRSPISVTVNTKRNTSTTTTSKGQAISISNLTAPSNSTNFQEPNQRPKLDLSFEDSKTAFKAKSTAELLRGYIVFQLCSLNFLVNNQKTVKLIFLN